MVWLQLVRIGNYSLYSWIEDYLTEASAVATGATISEEASSASARRLSECLSNDEVDLDRAFIELEDFLPGLRGGLEFSDGQRKRRVFNNLRGDHINAFVSGRRLGSPYHYRYYFAFSQPAGTLRDEEVAAFVSTADHDKAGTIKKFAALAEESRPQGGTKAEVLIDRLARSAREVPENSVEGILSAFASTMDTVALSSRDGDFGQHRAWEPAKRVVHLLVKRLAKERRAAAIQTLFAEGAALGWLTSILRDEIFAHGHFGDRSEPEDQRLLTDDEFKDVLALMLRRYRETPPYQLLGVPNLLSLLYGWLQGSGDDREVRQWVARLIETDAGLLNFLSRVRGWASGSDIGTYYPLKRRDLANFLDFDDVERRLAAINNQNGLEAEVRLAAELLTAIEQGKRI